MDAIEINGRYRLGSVIGEGGMGAVYRGVDTALRRPVAVKLVHASHAENQQIVRRLEREARACAAIASEHVVQVLDAGHDPAMGLFVVMELLAGEDLERRLAREQRLAPEEAIRIADQAARGLGHAHGRGVIHRDLKPANIFLCERDDGGDGERGRAPSLVKIVDFGIAKLVREGTGPISSRSGNLTSHGCVVGTPQYMSPEQAQGLDSIDLRTDVYSLGAVLFEMLTGQPPVPDFDHYEQKILHIVMHARPRLRDVMPGVDPALDALVAAMLAHDPNARPRDMHAVRERLGALVAGTGRASATSLTGISATSLSTPPPPPQSRLRRAAWVLPVIAGIGVGASGIHARAAAPAPRAHVEAPRVVAATAIAYATVGEKAARFEAPPPKVLPAELPARPIKLAPPPAPSASAPERPLGGTGLVQEF